MFRFPSSARVSLAPVCCHGDSACSSARAKRSGTWLGLLCALLLFAFGSLTCSATPPPVQYLGSPTTVFTSGINFPIGMAVDTSGNIYIANYYC